MFIIYQLPSKVRVFLSHIEKSSHKPFKLLWIERKYVVFISIPGGQRLGTTVHPKIPALDRLVPVWQLPNLVQDTTDFSG